MTVWGEFATAIARPGPAEGGFVALWHLAEAEIGAPLFTVMTFDPATWMARRVWSSMPQDYPPQGSKPMPASGWADQVLTRQQPYIANSIAEIATHFADHELILGLGFESCLNLPVVVSGRVLGTLNCLAGPGHYTAERVTRAARLVAPGAICLMRAASETDGKKDKA
ncbi:MAG: GAF domain-containing protein [Paracoccus sp. (in: a-proteobacteria)]|nr:GAF domain-containing protein [Paracoccus sp. (in: a-proteobacteria)]